MEQRQPVVMVGRAQILTTQSISHHGFQQHRQDSQAKLRAVAVEQLSAQGHREPDRMAVVTVQRQPERQHRQIPAVAVEVPSVVVALVSGVMVEAV
jgi:hypothetical protein